MVSIREAALLAACVAALVSTSDALATSCSIWGEKSGECLQTCGPVATGSKRYGCYYYGDDASTAGLYCTFGSVAGWSYACPPKLPAGSRVMRGSDWIWSSQDGGEGKIGTTAGAVDAEGWVQVCLHMRVRIFIFLSFLQNRILKFCFWPIAGATCRSVCTCLCMNTRCIRTTIHVYSCTYLRGLTFTRLHADAHFVFGHEKKQQIHTCISQSS
jgi:hypothetical protein